MGGLSDAISRAFGAKPGADVKAGEAASKAEQAKKKE
jgi:hypothetical protein